ncbi:MAG: hypothetical protein KDA96_11350, partial [Planctomycetaceae bacterium]|nr:hypothetical protein [Planctomycetaceae bacterium]
NDPQALEEGVEFKRAYNEKSIAFDRVAPELSALVQQYTSISLEEGERTGAVDREHNERIIAELNREEPHSLDEDLTYRRPYGFILDGEGTTGIRTWKRLFEVLCQQPLKRNPQRFHELPNNPDFISNRGHHGFSLNATDLRSASLIGDGIHAEINLSANMVRDVISRLLDTFEISHDKLKLFLRQDRDAECVREQGWRP